MTRLIICLSVCLLVLTLTDAAEERQLQAALPGESGTVALTFTLDDAGSAVFDTYSGITPPDPQVVPEPSTLALLGLGVLGLVCWRRRAANNDNGKREF